MSKQTIVVLRITSDDPGRPWWASLGIPEPGRWNVRGLSEFPPCGDAFAEVTLEADVALPLAPASREDDRI